MNERDFNKDIFNFLLSNPDKAFEEFEKMGIDFTNLKKIDIARLFVKEKFKLNENQLEAVDFVFWLSYFLERELEDIIKGTEKARMMNLENPMIEDMLDKLSFGDKIALIEKNYSTKSDDKSFNKFLWKIKDLRNSVAHGRFDKLKFGGYDLFDKKGQLKLLIEATNVFLKRK